MALAFCKILDTQASLEELYDLVRPALDNLLSGAESGALLMRWRICSQVAQQTQVAATLAATPSYGCDPPLRPRQRCFHDADKGGWSDTDVRCRT